MGSLYQTSLRRSRESHEDSLEIQGVAGAAEQHYIDNGNTYPNGSGCNLVGVLHEQVLKMVLLTPKEKAYDCVFTGTSYQCAARRY